MLKKNINAKNVSPQIQLKKEFVTLKLDSNVMTVWLGFLLINLRK